MNNQINLKQDNNKTNCSAGDNEEAAVDCRVCHCQSCPCQ